MVHALCCSLLDACLPLKTTFSAIKCAFTSDGNMLTDPTAQQEETASSQLSYIIDRKGNLVASHATGSFDTEEVRSLQIDSLFLLSRLHTPPSAINYLILHTLYTSIYIKNFMKPPTRP